MDFLFFFIFCGSTPRVCAVASVDNEICRSLIFFSKLLFIESIERLRAFDRVAGSIEEWLVGVSDISGKSTAWVFDVFSFAAFSASITNYNNLLKLRIVMNDG